MSYDFDGEPPTPTPPPRGIRARVSGWYWSFVLWCMLDSGSAVLERWGDRRIHKGGGK